MVNRPHLRTTAAATADRSPSGRERAAAAPPRDQES